MNFIIGPGRLYVAPLPPRRWSWAWLRTKLRRRTLSPRWVEIGFTTEGAP